MPPRRAVVWPLSLLPCGSVSLLGQTGAGGRRDDTMENAPLEAAQLQAGQALIVRRGDAIDANGSEILGTRGIHRDFLPAIGEINHDDKFVPGVAALETKDIARVGAMEPGDVVSAEGGVAAAQGGETVVDGKEVGAILGMPKEGEFLEERRVARFRGVASLHAVVKKRNAVER